MRNIHASTLAELAALEFRPFLLVDKVIASEHYRYTDCDVPLMSDGGIYLPLQLSLDTIKWSQRYLADTARISYDNIDETMTALYAGSVVQGEPTTIFLVTVDAAGTVIGEAVTLFPGYVDDWLLDETALDETLRSRVARGDVCTLKRYSPSCPWTVFKGTECGYAGDETWCDRTYARCRALANTDNFGGCRWLASLVTKEIWWGRTKAA